MAAIDYTTHLICTPEHANQSLVLQVMVHSGQSVHADEPLVSLLVDGSETTVHAPDDGIVQQILVQTGDALHAGELLLLMEIIEHSTQLYPLQSDDSPGFAAACQQDWSQPRAPAVPQWLQVTPAAATLAAQLGLDLSQVPAPDGLLDEACVLRHAREQLARLQQIRSLLTL